MCADTGDSELIGRFVGLARFEEEVDTAVGPVHVAGAVFELLWATDSVLEVAE
ncbi:hypothetical protein ACFQH2_15115 [Natronoarchaeum sp. GCM10025703]|uniref:hypothetical protein n=1 Tax=Natronoarchaeum sp. GCM10025703 TaxID=3252685 RepID=UPI0036136079